MKDLANDRIKSFKEEKTEKINENYESIVGYKKIKISGNSDIKKKIPNVKVIGDTAIVIFY